MKVLVACEESQAVCIAFRKLGHEAYSCDTQECSGGHPEWHIKGDVLPLINGNKPFITMDGDLHAIVGTWDLLIAFPPCTYLTNAGSVRSCRNIPKRYSRGGSDTLTRSGLACGLKTSPPLPLPILFGKELPRMLMEVVKTLMGITGDFRGEMSVTQKLVQKHFRVLHKQWPNSGEAI